MALLDAVPDFAGKSDWNTLLASDLNGAGLMAGQLGGMMTEQGLYQSPLTDLGRRFLAFVGDPTGHTPS